jgi:hypothetical protein
MRLGENRRPGPGWMRADSWGERLKSTRSRHSTRRMEIETLRALSDCRKRALTDLSHTLYKLFRPVYKLSRVVVISAKGGGHDSLGKRLKSKTPQGASPEIQHIGLCRAGMCCDRHSGSSIGNRLAVVARGRRCCGHSTERQLQNAGPPKTGREPTDARRRPWLPGAVTARQVVDLSQCSRTTSV